MDNLRHEDLTREIIKTYFHVYNSLGSGFLESVYQNAFLHSLRKLKMNVESEKSISVHFEGMIVGKFFADIIVNQLVIIEIKSIRQLTLQHEAQLFNYLKATPIEIGLLFNFGNSEPEFQRKIVTNDRKPHLKNLS